MKLADSVAAASHHSGMRTRSRCESQRWRARASSVGAMRPTRRTTLFSSRSWCTCSTETAADDGCALATVGLGKFGTGFGGALTPSPLPTCNGRQNPKDPKSLLVFPQRASSRWARRQLLPQLVVRQRVCASWPPLDLIPRVLMSTDVESCDLQRCPLSCRGFESGLSVIAPATNPTSWLLLCFAGR